MVLQRQVRFVNGDVARVYVKAPICIGLEIRSISEAEPGYVLRLIGRRLRRIILLVEIGMNGRVLAQRKNCGNILVEWLEHGNFNVLSVKHLCFHKRSLVLCYLRAVHWVVSWVLLQHRR